MAISVGSVEVDVVPNTRGIYGRLRDGLVPAATRAGEDAGSAAGRSFGPAMQRQVGDVGLRIGEEIGQQIANRLTAALRDAIRDGVTQGGRAARPAATRQGDETAGAFSRSLKARLEAAFRSLPKLQIGADTSEADADLQALRVRMETLSGQRVGIDIDAEAAKAEIRLIEAELTRLGAEHPNVQVRADTAAALAQMAAVRAEIDAVDGRTARVNLDTSGAKSALFQLTVAIAGLAAIPAIPVLAAGIGAITSAAVSAGAGVGALAAVAVPAFINIKGALDAQKQAQAAATTATASGGQAASTAARQTLQQAGAQQQLAAAHRTAARSIMQAQQGVQDAVRSAAHADATAAAQVRSARQALAQAYQQASDRMRSANEQVATAEQSLADAQRTARQAQQDLTQARRDAVVELQDLSNQLADAQLSERDAALGVVEAQRRLRAVQAAGSNASVLEQQRAQLAYDQAVQRLKEQQLDTKRLTAEKKTADKAGVSGSDTVRTAQERLAAAQRGVASQEAALSKARQDRQRTEVQNAQHIADAQGKVASAQQNVAAVQEQGARSVARAQQQLAAARQSAADSITSAERQVSSSELQSAGGANTAATAQAKYAAALAKLSPAARGTFNAFVRLRSAFKAWSTALQPTVMPIFTRALNGMRKALPGLTPFVLAAARAIGVLQDKASAGFKSPWWRTFKKDLAGSVQPAIVGLGLAFGNIFKGMGGIVDAFLPHMDSISSRLQRITGRFANWGASLKGSPEFEGFLAYASRMAPVLATNLGKIAGAFYQVARSLSPLSGPVLTVLGVLADGIAQVAIHAPFLVQAIYALVVVTKLWTIAQTLLDAVLTANPVGLVIAGITLLVGAVIYAYKNFGWFRTAVQAAWAGIQVAALFAWNSVLKPVFAAIMVAIRFVGRVAMWLWRNAFGPAFRGIATVAKWLGIVIAVIVVGSMVLAFRALAAVGRWLWRNALGPAFRGIAAVGRWLWNNVMRPILRLWMLEFRALAAVGRWLWRTALAPAFRGIATVARWLWDKAIRPVFNWIADKAKWLYQHGIKPWFDAIKRAAGFVVDAFRKAKDGIGKAWAKIKDLTKKPIAWVIDIVYNKGVRGLWNAAASVLPIKKLPAFKPKGFAQGGILPGRSSYRQGDDQMVPMRRGEGVYVSEAMRDPYERARLHAVNRAAMRGGSLNKFRDTGFAKGGIIGDIGSGLGKVGGWVKSGFGKLKDLALGGVYKAVSAAARPVRALIDRIPGGKTGFGQMATAVPKSLISEVLSAVKGSETAQMGGAGVARALKWARTQAGKPYQWGGNNNPSWDCSGFMSAIESVIRGQKPHRRWATGSFHGKTAPAGWKWHTKSPFQIGVTNRGVGHTAGTLAGVNVESRGGTGVTVGPSARGYKDSYFGNSWYGFTPAIGGGGGAGPKSAARQMLGEFGWSQSQWPALEKLWQKESGWRWNARNSSSGAYGIPQALPGSKMRSAGADWKTNPTTQIRWGEKYIKGRYGSPAAAWAHSQRANWYDNGGYLPEGLSLVNNGTGAPEPVLTKQQLGALQGSGVRGGDGAALGDLHVKVFVGNREITDIARAEVRTENGRMLTALNARPGR